MTKRTLSFLMLVFCAVSASAQPPSSTPPVVVQQELDPAIASAITSAEAGWSADRNCWVSGEFMFGKVQSTKLPPLITTSAVDDIDRASAGTLANSATRIAYAGPVNDNLRAGFRIGAGVWFYPDAGWGIEAGFSILESQSAFYSIASNGPILARPYYDAITRESQAVLVAFPGSSTGSIGVQATSDNFYGFNLNLMQRACDVGWFRLNTLLGYRFYNYNESLRIQQNLFPTDANFVAGTSIVSIDTFGTRNHFHGLDLGLRTEFSWDALSLEILTKVAFGRLHTAASISGQQVTSVPGTDPVVANAGVFALGSNIGNYSAYRLAASPEFGATLKWQVSSNLQVRLGYSFQLLGDVLRAADQVDTTIDPANFPPATTPGRRPAFQFQRSDVWIQTISGGVAFTF